jgi:hypothetical protein
MVCMAGAGSTGGRALVMAGSGCAVLAVLNGLENGSLIRIVSELQAAAALPRSPTAASRDRV